MSRGSPTITRLFSGPPNRWNMLASRDDRSRKRTGRECWVKGLYTTRLWSFSGGISYSQPRYLQTSDYVVISQNTRTNQHKPKYYVRTLGTKRRLGNFIINIPETGITIKHALVWKPVYWQNSVLHFLSWTLKMNRMKFLTGVCVTLNSLGSSIACLIYLTISDADA